MFNDCSGVNISGGVLNNVKGDQYNHTYRTINRGSHNVTNNGVTSGLDLGSQQAHSRASHGRAAPAPVQNESSEASSAQQPPQAQRSVQSSPNGAFPVPGESCGVPTAQVIHHPSPHSASAQVEMQDQDVDMEVDEEDGGANAYY
ncbi:hypothetical protein MPER_08608 [Moniliophthora perniciosa FA553]|nr:hypothetical protein MPER_08608 [Moniliophthora perniciosa FA553]